MKTELYFVMIAAVGLMVLMSGFFTIRKIVVAALKKNNAKVLTLPPGNKQLEWAGSAGIPELYTSFSSDFQKCNNSKVVQRFVR